MLRWSRRTTRSRACSIRKDTPEAEYTDVLELDLATVEPSIAGPKRPQDRVVLSEAGRSFDEALPTLLKPGQQVPQSRKRDGRVRADIRRGWIRRSLRWKWSNSMFR